MTTLSTIMKWAAIAALFFAALFSAIAANSVLLRFIVGGGATFVAFESLLARRYVQGAAFVTVAAVFNPIFPIVLPPMASIALDLATAGLFVSALTFWQIRETPRLSMPSITDRTPGSQSL